MKRLSFRLKSFLTLYFAVILVVAVIFYGTSLFGAPQIVAPLCEFKNIPADETARQKITVQNPTRQPLQLIGAMVPCTLCGCASTEGLPVTIPPGQSGSVTVLFKATAAGPFKTEIELYTDNPDQTIVRLQVRGTVKPDAEDQPLK
ncbi:DUF1573 domain-containing protein [Gimesia algae]|uniref:DUF1573 domain-containing protein n=1 Tax=Gimesia algae TaxID=2527971 RepID=A0A517VN92_9PLAN|nr:DUF1573 domain-containing protein [Gimesia algae]QDT94492.1 hypothetical protein Pan161_61880 [Gimesia algae]